MLVLNTNQGNSETIINKNSMIVYPDIENSILFFPRDYWWTSMPTVMTVWGTPIHQFCWSANQEMFFKRLSLEQFYEGSSKWNPPIVWQYIAWSAYPVRISHELPLNFNWTIWKTIILPELISNKSWYKPKFRIWVLHSNWNIDYFNSDWTEYSPSIWNCVIQSWDYANRSDSSTSWYIYGPTNKIIETNWLSVIEWDRVVFEINHNQSSNNCSFFWGSETPTTYNNTIKPLQISID